MDVARGLGRLVSVVAVTGVLVAAPAPAFADCQMAPPICTATAPWVEGFAVVRPADARTPLPSATGTASGPLAAVADLALPLLTALLIGGAAVAVAVVVSRRRTS